MLSFAITRSFLAVSLICAALPVPAFAFAPPPAQDAQAPVAAVDEVRLVSGGFIRGELVESSPGSHVLIIPRGTGEARRIDWADISELVRGGEGVAPGPVVVPTPAPSVQPTPSPPVEPTPAVDDDATGEGALIHINQTGDAERMLLFRVDGEAVASSGGYTAHAVAYSEVCESPCDVVLADHGGQFFVNGQKKYSPSSRFRLSGDYPRYDLDVKVGKRGTIIGGYVVMISGIVATGLMVAGPFFVDMPVRPHAAGMWAGAALVGGFGIGGGVTMMFLGRSKVKIRPGG